MALSGGVDGLSIIRRLLQDSPQYLKEGGLLVMEIGFDQGESTEALIQSNVWDLLEIVPDLAGIPRIIVLQKLAATTRSCPLSCHIRLPHGVYVSESEKPNQ